MKLPDVDKMNQIAKSKRERDEEEKRKREEETIQRREAFSKGEEERIAAHILNNIGKMIEDAARYGETMFRISDEYGWRKEGYSLGKDMPEPNPKNIAAIVEREIRGSGYSFWYSEYDSGESHYGPTMVREYVCSWRKEL